MILSDIKCVNSVTYLQNYVTFIFMEMSNFVLRALNLHSGNN
jgi:hypothetical protein